MGLAHDFNLVAYYYIGYSQLLHFITAQINKKASV